MISYILVMTILKIVLILFRWLIRCHKGYSFKFQVTHVDVSKKHDPLSLFAISSDGSKTIITQVTTVGMIETNTNQLLISFRSYCNTTCSSFGGILTVVRSEDHQKTVPSILTTHLPKTPITTYKTTLVTTTALPETKTNQITALPTSQTTQNISGNLIKTKQ